MKAEINARNAARALEKFFLDKAGTKLRHSEALELLAGMCGFSEYRAMAAEAAVQDKVPANGDPRQTISLPLKDWVLLDDPQDTMEQHTPETHRPYEAKVRLWGNHLSVTVQPAGLKDEELVGKPVLETWFEINGGVPAMYASNENGENLMAVFATQDGLFVRQEEGRWANTDETREGTELHRVVQGRCNLPNGDGGFLLLHDTAVKYDVQPA